MVLSKKVRSGESLGRFLTQSKHFARVKNEVKFKVFMPPKNLKLSVQRIDELTPDEVWVLGKQVVSEMPEPNPPLYGVADIKAGVIERVNLIVSPDKFPSRHANINKWPSDIAEQLSIAQELAAEAKLILIP